MPLATILTRFHYEVPGTFEFQVKPYFCLAVHNGEKYATTKQEAIQHPCYVENKRTTRAWRSDDFDSWEDLNLMPGDEIYMECGDTYIEGKVTEAGSLAFWVEGVMTVFYK
jgi:hypothetical protein